MSDTDNNSVDVRTDPPGPGAWRQILEFAATLLVAFLLAQAVRAWVIQPYVVPTGSMLPTIQLRDHVLGNKFVYRFGSPKPGDIVILDDPTGQVGTLIKRCIAVGGQTLELQGGRVVIDGKPLDESYTYGQPSEPLPDSLVRYPVTIPEGYVWVMGDNRTQSQDSRWFGPVPESSVQGKGFFIYWPMSRFGTLK